MSVSSSKITQKHQNVLNIPQNCGYLLQVNMPIDTCIDHLYYHENDSNFLLHQMTTLVQNITIGADTVQPRASYVALPLCAE